MRILPSSRNSLGLEYQRWAAGLVPGDYPGIATHALLAFRAWACSLPAAHIQRVARETAELCASAGMDETALRETLRSAIPTTPQARMLVYFGMAVHARWLVLNHAGIQAWLENPQSRSNRAFGWQLYLRLVEAGFTTIPGEFLMGTPEQRGRIIQEAIRNAYAQDYALLLALTREITYLQSTPQRNLLGMISPR